jgi:hypothetical protein
MAKEALSPINPYLKVIINAAITGAQFNYMAVI